ncbi:MAG TPA: sensor histidine kinase [Spirochaetes bacterium]|nr:sensor histidine kinase [Spirochaetota bacterium]
MFPLGIIVNELMSNVFKYAFSDGREGNITISFSTREDGSKELVFQDDGVGMTDVPVDGKPKGFGLELVDMLAKQIGGKVEIAGGQGTRFSVVFNIKEPR